MVPLRAISVDEPCHLVDVGNMSDAGKTLGHGERWLVVQKIRRGAGAQGIS
jgi:hypothetical protein